MPRRGSMRARRGFSRPRRKLVWARVQANGNAPIGITPALANPVRLDGLLEFEQSLGASTVGVTVRRIRGYFAVYDVDQVAGRVDQIRFTAYVGDNNDVDRGVNANDNSFDDLSQNRDFFLYEPFLLPAGGSVQAVGTDVQSRLIDNRSSRKIEELNETLIFDVSAFSANNADGAAQLGFSFDLSILLALP